MDCISCDKCRLNGKVQIRGLATTLKLLFLPSKRKMMTDIGQMGAEIEKSDIISLIQLLQKVSESIEIY